ncbi:cell surface protein SprA [Cytophagales bacterium RKSG123]|nr:cell surface protein SprA [Xanthovirga aplysinae]
MDVQVELDTTINYTISEQIGEVPFRQSNQMSFDEFNEVQEKRMLKEYWKSRSAGLDGESPVSGRDLIPPIYISPIFDRIFGGSYVKITPSGFVTLDFSSRWQRTHNPAWPINRQRNFLPLEFDQQISTNVKGKVGEKLEINANFDNNTSFDFENNMKVEFTGFDTDIIKKIEFGNVSMPVDNSLIAGGQNLFGIKTQLQFGKLYVTAVASSQRGQADEVEIEGGAQSRPFEFRASSYDENRHFFLGHFFRDNYEGWLSRLPQVLSGVNINPARVEVYVLKQGNVTQNIRNVVVLMDLGEGKVIANTDVVASNGANSPSDNNANNILSLRTGNALEDVVGLENAGLKKGLDFLQVNGARKLDQNEYRVNQQLGYISLNRKLQADEFLAVSFEYTYNGTRYKVGEMSEDYAGRTDKEVIYLKLLKPDKINPEIPTWDLMMKNVYSLNASQISKDGFKMQVIYKDDRTGQDLPTLQDGAQLKNKPLIEVMGLDRLNMNSDTGKDGNFDFVEGVTINPENGSLFFPVLEPFGEHLAKQFTTGEDALVSKYVYQELYTQTRNDAMQLTTKDKFFLKGEVSGGSSSEIFLDGINISEGSVRVTAGSTVLMEGQDYTVDYMLGKVTLLNQGILNSGQKIKISYEKADLFNFRSRTMVGSRFDYRFNENMNLGATLLHLNEVPFNTRPVIGDEPISNTIWGLDFNMNKDSRFITKMVDWLPLLKTKETSSITLNTEFAQLRPGTSNIVDGEGPSYIDDFENSAIPFSLNIPNNWKISSVPATKNNDFDVSGGAIDDLRAGEKRAKLSWYNIDQSFYTKSGPNKRPSNITEEDMKNHYVRSIGPQEIFRGKDIEPVQTYETTFDLAYFPSERGPYNFSENLNPDGTLKNPEGNWAGITQAISSNTDFDQNNIEYIEFWLLDPFLTGENGKVLDKPNTTGGELVFNLGDVSESVLKDGQLHFENGLPADGSDNGVAFSAWGRYSTKQNLTGAFENTSEEARANQDVGLNGLNNERAREHYPDFITALGRLNLLPEAYEQIMADPDGDDFEFYLGDNHDQNDHKVVERYKNFRGLSGNTPFASTNGFSASNSNDPDSEDLLGNNTLNDLENYYEYKVHLKPNNLKVGENHIVDKVSKDIDGEEVNWYLFRIPVREVGPGNTYGEISGFKNMRFMRTYLTGFSEPVVLRMAKFQLVGSQWRKYDGNLRDPEFSEYPPAGNTKFNISVVNIEENGQGGDSKSGYDLPPGMVRDTDNTSLNSRQLNEQSLQLCVEDLEDKDARAVFKNVNLNMINYGRMKMFIHAESETAGNGEVSAFIRLGTDFVNNYYEIEVPLDMTPNGSTDRHQIWPDQNEIDIVFDDLYTLKSARNRERVDDRSLPFSQEVGKYRLTVVGNPDMSAVATVMIGIRNPESQDGAPKSVCIWANELRVTEFNTKSAWAANAAVNLKLADFANVTASGQFTSSGFGGLEQGISQRTREEAKAYAVGANVNLDKLLPEKAGLKIPMYVSYQKSQLTPEFDPLDPDIPLKSALNAIEDPEEKEEYKEMVIDQEVRRSINFSNVRKEKTNPDAKKHIYDVENFSVSYAYSEVKQSDINTASYESRNYSGSLDYNFTPKPVNVEPFKKIKAFNNPYFQLFKDFNFSLLPSSLSFRTSMDRRFTRTQLRDQFLKTDGLDPIWEKTFTMDRQYNLRWNLTKSLALDYSALANAIVDEPEGDIDTQEKKDQVWENIRKLGRIKGYDQKIGLNYKLPLDKFPLTNWTSANANYSVSYFWTAGTFLEGDPADTLDLGSIIENQRGWGLTGKIDLVKLYNKSGRLKEINQPTRRRPRKPQDGEEGEEEEKESRVLNGFLRVLMSLRSMTFTYDKSEGTYLPGFKQSPTYFGLNKDSFAPGLPFILGSQDPGIRSEAVKNGWLINSSSLTQPFSQYNRLSFSVKATVEPLKDLRIQLDANKSKMDNYSEIFRVETDGGDDFTSLTPTRSGTYDISFFTLGTSFSKENKEHNSAVFKKFEEYRNTIQNRLNATRGAGPSYGLNSQDVLIPAFLAAYGDKDPNEVALSPFPKVPVPNWRMTYAGLGKLAAFQDIFSSVNVSHAYQSMYSVNNYSNSLLYNENELFLLNKNIEKYPSATRVGENGNLVPVFIIDQVTITERYAPLIGVDVKTKSRITTSIEYQMQRTLTLSMTNAEVTESNNKGFTFNFGYTTSNFKLPFRVQGRTVRLKNDLKFNMGLSIGKNQTLQRKLDEESIITDGNNSFSIKPTISYMTMKNKLNLLVYFERNVNEPLVGSSYTHSDTAVGAQLRFNLSQ